MNDIYRKYVLGVDFGFEDEPIERCDEEEDSLGSHLCQLERRLEREIGRNNKQFLSKEDVVACHVCDALVEKSNSDRIIISDEERTWPHTFTIGVNFFDAGPVKEPTIKSEDDDYRYYCGIHKPKDVDRIVNGEEKKFIKSNKKKK